MGRFLTIALLLSCVLNGSATGDPISTEPDLHVTDTFTLPVKLRAAQQLFEARRYRDAEIEFEQLRVALGPQSTEDAYRHFDSYVSVLGYLAQSRSLQGKNGTVSSLMLERHALIAAAHDDRGYQFATSLGKVAEAQYRQGHGEEAIILVQRSIHIYESLNPVPALALSRARKNHAQYRVAPFSNAMLPVDLSDFYSRCEAIQSGDSHETAGSLMTSFVEVGVDYIPEGSWFTYFNAIKYPALSDYKDASERRVFIPDASETMRSEICTVSIESGIVVSAETALD